MSVNLATIAITAGEEASYTTQLYGLRALVIGNESGLTCTITMQGGNVQKTLYPSTVDWFEVQEAFTGKIIIDPSVVLSNASSYTGNSIIIDGIAPNDQEQASSYPMALPRAAVSSTASGKPLFTATVGFGATATKHQVLNVFNPANSGVTYTFYSARAFTSSSTAGVRAFLALSPGDDLNLNTPVSAISHVGDASPPISTANCTAWDSDTGLAGTDIEDLNPSTSVTEDFLAFPDYYTLLPGNNLRVVMDDPSATGKVVRLTMKWSEE